MHVNINTISAGLFMQRGIYVNSLLQHSYTQESYRRKLRFLYKELKELISTKLLTKKLRAVKDVVRNKEAERLIILLYIK